MVIVHVHRFGKEDKAGGIAGGTAGKKWKKAGRKLEESWKKARTG